MSDRRFRRPVFQPFFYPSDFCLKSSIGALKIAQIFQKSIFSLCFAKILLVFLPFFLYFIQFFLPSSSFSFLRLDFATLNLPTGGRSSVPLTPLNGHSHSLVPMFPFLFFFSLLIKNFHKYSHIHKNFHKINLKNFY